MVRVLVLRNRETGNWKFLEIETKQFEQSNYPRYQFYKSCISQKDASDYAKGVEASERKIGFTP
jgi:hypothetical protein